MDSGTQRAKRTQKTKSSILFVLFCVLIALGIVGLSLFVGFRWGPEIFLRWGGLTAFTLVLFGLFVGDSEKFLRKRRFWLVTTVLLAGHLAAFIVVLTHVQQWKLMWFMVMVIEYPILLFSRNIFVIPE